MSYPLYRAILALHIIAVISWMAGILYLFRLFVYHATEKEAVVRQRFEMMESRLHRIIVHPAMGMSLLLGLAMLALNTELLKKPWMHGKLTLVAGMMAVTIFSGRIMRELKDGKARYSDKGFRILNEVPTLLMIGIVFLVIMRPWN